MAKAPTWIATLRRDLRLQNGEGWYAKDVRGRIQLAYRFADSTQTTCTLELPWAGSSKLPLLQAAAAAKPLVEAGKSLKEAIALIARCEGITEKGATNWPRVAELFHQHKVGSGEISERTWTRNYRLRISRAVELLAGKQRPTGGPGLMQALVDQHFAGGKGAGETDRRLQIQYVGQFLTFAVQEQGADSRWLPPADLRRFVGVKQKGHTMATFISDDQICRLLAEITDPQWRTAVGLVACFGLRPVELGHLTANGDTLRCTYSKRTARKPTGTPPREILGLDPAGLEGLSANLLALLAERGKEALPPGCRGERAGDALHQYLERHKVWQTLVQEVAEAPAVGNTGNELVPYSLRHAYADRASVVSLSDKEAALLMGHSLQTHHSHYSGTTADTMARAKAKLQARSRQLQPVT
jgi:integrase